MAKFLRVLLAVVVGVAVGSAVNMGLIMVSGKIVPPPAGVDLLFAYAPMAWLAQLLATRGVYRAA